MFPSLRRLTVGPDHCELVSHSAAVPWRPSLPVGCRGARRWGWCGGFAPCEALCRRVAGVSHPCMAQFPPPRRLSDGRGAQNADHLGKNGEIGLFGVRRSAFWATLGYKLLAYTSATTWLECSQPNSHVVGSHVNPLCRTLTLECACKPLDTHVNRSTCVWAALPTRRSSG